MESIWNFKRISRWAPGAFLACWMAGAGFSAEKLKGMDGGGVVIGSLPRLPHGVSAGELLLGELNCIACHEAEEPVRTRLNARSAPILQEIGARATPHWVRSFLLDPSGEKPGTPMPDLLHGMTEGEKAETAEALVHFLFSLGGGEPSEATGADMFKMQQGRLLYHQVGCVACHAPQEPVAALKPAAGGGGEGSERAAGGGVSGTMLTPSTPLGDLSRKTTVEALARFLLDPAKTRPSGRMPSLNLTAAEATAIAMYLLRDQAPGMLNPGIPMEKIRGVRYEYYEADFGSDRDFDALKPVGAGVADRFVMSPRKRQDNVGLRFSGILTVAKDGAHTFYTSSDDGSRLYLGDKLVVDNGGVHGTTERRGTIELKAGDHPIVVTWFNGGGEASLKVSYEGPGFSKREIPAEVLSHLGQAMTPLGSEKFFVDSNKAASGRRLFSQLGCAACHSLDQVATGPRVKAKAFGELNAAGPGGCLDALGAKGAPKYDLAADQREALKTAVSDRAGLGRVLDAKTRVARGMASLNCYACHSRDGIGGPSPDRAEYFSVRGDADLGDEGRIPPHLTDVAGKLKPEWLEEVLLRGTPSRPYMAARMPRFGEANVRLLLEDLAATAPPAEPEAAEHALRDVKFGRKLTGVGGVACVSCHTFGKHPSLGIPAMDLTAMSKRLRRDWFERYLADPAALRPGTRMPSFWPDGKAANQDILGGNTHQQIGAIWAYLSQGAAADPPPGLIQGKKEIVVGDEAVIYRNFIEGAGSRAIGVGYPEKANLAFDANDVRLAMIWHGAFIDGARHGSGRGAGFEPPLGNNVVSLPAGAPFALLPDGGSPWPLASGKKADFRMKGYRLDDKRRPAFLYAFGSIQIEDYTVAVAGELDPILRRSFTLRSREPVNNLWFLAAAGSKIAAGPGGSFVVDGKLQLKFLGGGPPMVRASNGRKELLVPIVFEDGEARFTEELVW